MNKLCWFSLISNRMFYPLNLINQQQVKEKYSFSFLWEFYFRLPMDYDE